MTRYKARTYWFEYPFEGRPRYYPFRILKEKAVVLKLVGNWKETMAVLERNLEETLRSGDQAEIAQAKVDLSVMLDARGQAERAYLLAEEAMAIWRSRGDKLGMIKAANALGSVHHHRSEFSKAMEFFEDSLELSSQLGREREVCQALNHIGLIYYEMHDIKSSLDHYTRSLQIAEKMKDRQYIAMAAGNIGNVHLETEELDKALECYQRALDESRLAGDKQSIAFGVGNMAIIYQKKGDYDSALKWTRQQYEVFTELGDEVHLIVSLLNLGNTYLDIGDLEQARDHLLRQTALAERHNDLPILSYGHYLLGQVWNYLGDDDRAEKAYSRAVRIGQELGFDYYLCGYQAALARFFLERGQTETAKSRLLLAREAAQRAGRDDVLFGIEVLEAGCLASTAADEAISLLRELVGKAKDQEQRAEARLQLFRISRRDADRQGAKEEYLKLKGRTEKYIYRRALAELETD